MLTRTTFTDGREEREFHFAHGVSVSSAWERTVASFTSEEAQLIDRIFVVDGGQTHEFDRFGPVSFQ